LGVLSALESISPDMVKRVKVLWSLPLNANPNIEVTSLRFDHAMILVSLGLAHRARASELLRACGSDVNSDDYKAASSELSIAAGIFDYCSKQPLVAWGGIDGGNVVELSGVFHRAMVELSLMEAQALTVRKGIMNGIGLGAMNKVISGVVDLAERCKTSFGDLRRSFTWDIPSITMMHQYVSLFHACYKTILFHRLGLEEIDNSEYGKSVCFGKQGSLPSDVGSLLKDKKALAEMPSFIELINPVFDFASKSFATWEKDNKNIYYERVPDASDCPPPKPACLAKITPYQEPFAIPPQISFQQASCLVM